MASGVPRSAATSRRLQAASVATSPNGPSIASAMISVPGARSGARPPAVPKLTMPAQPRATASDSARSSRSARAANTVSTPSPAAIFASNAMPLTAITGERVVVVAISIYIPTVTRRVPLRRRLR